MIEKLTNFFADKKSCCLLDGKELHYLDHLAPLADLLAIPLFISDPNVFEACIESYPSSCPAQYIDREDLPLTISSYEQVVYCFSKRHLEASLSYDIESKGIQPIWCPHGYSDKNNLAPLQYETAVLSYGKRFRKRVEKYSKAKQIPLSNYRHHYYKQNKAFFQTLLAKKFPTLKNSLTPTILYCPTWEDYEKSSSVSHVEKIIQAIPPSYTLLLKAHPNTLYTDPIRWILLQKRYEGKNVLFLDLFPPVYPLLDFVDCYLGDNSSVGYDFLSFCKPMFFINTFQNSPIKHCGYSIDHPEELKTIIKQDTTKFIPLQKRLSKEIFSGSTDKA